MTGFLRYRLDHVIFWLLTVAFHAYTSLGLISEFGLSVYLAEVLVRNLLLAGVIHFNLRLTVRLGEQKKYAATILILVGSLAGYAVAKSGFNNLLIDESFASRLFYNFSIAFFYLGFSLALHFTKQWYIQRELLRRIEVEKLNTELEYLRSQINPHFLFNSINTIYFQIDKKNQTARETLSRFSDMLRYQLYECNGQVIPVEKELNYLENYVELQRLRKDENFRIEFNATPDLSGFSVPPLILMPFIENAFKHVSHHTEENNIVKIDLARDGQDFKLHVFNTKDTLPGVGSNGIGLKNARRRLELLYPDSHSLAIEEGQRTYSVQLTFRIKSQGQ